MWRRVQVDRPRSSTSGGQSSVVAVEVVGLGVGFEVLVGSATVPFIIAFQLAEDVQVRHL